MADNVAYTPGSGATIAADEIGGVLHQRIKIGIGADGVATDLSAANPMPTSEQGELVEAIEALRMAVHSLTRSIGQTYPDGAGRMRVLVDAITGSLTLGTVTNITNLPTLANVTTVGTLTGQTNIGGFAATEQVRAGMQMSAETLRRNISVT